jgi:AAA domain
VPIEFRPARRENVPLLIGLTGGTGSGKTYTALRLAQALAAGRPIAFADTENNRALHYADVFRFDHTTLVAPFRPHRYGEVIQAADAAGYPVIVVDSFSHEHTGDGGVLDYQEDELRRLAGDDRDKADRYKMLSWQAPKREHKRLVTELLQVRAHVILCFRAEPKVEMVKDGGKTIVREKHGLMCYQGWCPVTDARLPFEMTVFLMFMAERPGVPIPIKLEEQHKPFFPLDRVVDETSGRRLAEWASGGVTWVTKIAAAPTLEALRRVGRELNLVKATLEASVVEEARVAYEARQSELTRKPKAQEGAHP